MAELTKAQVSALKTVERRDWPAGEPRIGWLPVATARVLRRLGLIEERPGTAATDIFWKKSPIVDLTDAGREALSQLRKT